MILHPQYRTTYLKTYCGMEKRQEALRAMRKLFRDEYNDNQPEKHQQHKIGPLTYLRLSYSDLIAIFGRLRHSMRIELL